MNPLLPSSKKFHCVTSGEKRAEPCMGCTNSNACMTDSMQIKEPEVNSSQKAVVKVSSDGEVMKCAKGLDGAECGYKAGAKVCGAGGGGWGGGDAVGGAEAVGAGQTVEAR